MASGECVWTYHPPVPPATTGYWTVIDECESGSCSSGLSKKEAETLKVSHTEFAAKVPEEYKKRGKKVPDGDAALLATLTKDPKPADALKQQVIRMPCV